MAVPPNHEWHADCVCTRIYLTVPDASHQRGEAVVIAIDYESAPSAFRFLLQSERNEGARRELQTAIAEALDAGERHIVIDCRAWLEFDLLILSALVHCANLCDGHGATLRFENLSDDLRARIAALFVSPRSSFALQTSSA